MSHGRSYGDYLREAREQQGIDLVTMARALHIRPDIVGAIETADFKKMPAHGYTKNMVRAYAQKVGLNENELCEMYLTQREEHDGVTYSHSVSLSSRPVARSAATSQRMPARSQRPAASQNISRSQRISERNQRRSFKKDTQRLSQVRPSFTQGSATPSIASTRHTPRSGAGFSLPAINIPIVLGAVVLIAVVIILVVVFTNGNKQSTTDVPNIPISGLTDTSAVDESSASKLAAAPSSAVFSFSVAEGKKSWIAVYLDGAETPEYAAVAEGPTSKDFNVTGTLTFETANIEPVTLTLDGEEVKATPASKGTNYVYTVDFPSILAAWKKAHDITEDTSQEASASASAESAATTTNTKAASS